MGTAKTQQTKKVWFLNRFMIAKRELIELDREKLICNFCLDNNSTRKTALELLKIFETTGAIKTEGNFIIIK